MLLGLGALLAGTPDDTQHLHKANQYTCTKRNIPRGTEYLGRGAYGVVVKDIFVNDQEEQISVAVKIIRIQKKKSQQIQALNPGVYDADNRGIDTPADDYEYDHDHITKELNCLRILAFSKYTARLIGTFWGPSRYEIGIVMQAEDSNLHKWIYKLHGRDAFKRIKTVFRKFMQGLRDIHSANLIHLDLKPDNILMTGDHPRICDFGMSIPDDCLATKETRDYVVTVPYRAPEIARGDTKYTKSIDIWAAGCILYEMIHQGKLLFEVRDHGDSVVENQRLTKLHRMFFNSAKIRKKKCKLPNACPDKFTSIFHSILNSCLQRKENRTITAAIVVLKLL